MDEAQAVRAGSVRKLQDLRARLFELAGRPFSLDSSQQLEPILQARGVDLTETLRTPTGLLARSAKALERIDDELVRTLLEHRTERIFHGLLDGLVKRIVDGRLYGTYRQVGTDTGRMASGNPNLQNIPKADLRIRYVIRAGEGPGPGRLRSRQRRAASAQLLRPGWGAREGVPRRRRTCISKPLTPLASAARSASASITPSSTAAERRCSRRFWVSISRRPTPS